MLVEFTVVPVTEVPQVRTGRLGAVHRSLAGAGSVTVKLPALVAVPLAVVTLMVPVVAPVGTVAVTVVALTPVKVTAAVPLKLTPVTPFRLAPVMVTEVPIGPLVGVKLVMAGEVTVKLPLLVAEPFDVVTLMVPVVAPAGTVAVAVVALTPVKVTAAVPLKLTALRPVRLVPVMVTEVPTGPLVGVKLVMVGGGLTQVVVSTNGPWLALYPLTNTRYDVPSTEVNVTVEAVLLAAQAASSLAVTHVRAPQAPVYTKSLES